MIASKCDKESKESKESCIETFRSLLNHPNIDVNKQDNEGNTSLIELCKKDNIDVYNEMIELLLAHKNVDVNKENKNGQTALMLLICKGDPPIVAIKLLLSHSDLDINRQDNAGCTYLMKICSNCRNEEDAKIVKLILDHPNININMQNNNNQTALSLTMRRDDQKICSEITKLLYSHPKLVMNIDELRASIEKDASHIEILVPKIFNPLVFDHSLIAKILEKYGDKPRIINLCGIHIDIKKTIMKHILDHKEQLYCSPNNIIA